MEKKQQKSSQDRVLLLRLKRSIQLIEEKNKFHTTTQSTDK